MNLSELKQFLAKNGTRAKKSFSQNFLFNDESLGKIAGAIPQNAGFYIEIGGGLGALTEKALERSLSPLTVTDIDATMLGILKKRFSEQASVVEADGAKLRLEPFFEGKRGYIFGNLPYQVSSLIVMNTCLESRFIDGAVFLLQKEVSERFSAEPQNRDFGPIAALIRFLGHSDYLFTLPPEDFYPAPKVESGLLKITFERHDFDRTRLESFANTARILFSNRRKTMQNVFKINGLDQKILKIHGDIAAKRSEELDWQTILMLEEEIYRRKNE